VLFFIKLVIIRGSVQVCTHNHWKSIMGKSIRPSPHPESSYLSDYYTIEGLIRYAEGRMFYIVNDHRPDRSTKYCWDCGDDTSPTTAASCVACQKPMNLRKFLVSVRWQEDQKHSFKDFFEDKNFPHETMLSPFDMFTIRNSMYVVYNWDDYEFLLDLSSPWQGSEVLNFAQRMLGLIAHLQMNGVALENLGIHNFLIDSKNNKILFFDPVISKIYQSRVPEVNSYREIGLLAAVLQRFVSLSDSPLNTLLENASNSHFSNPYEMGREIEKLLVEEYAPKLDPNISAMSDVGLIRVLNEDNWGWIEITESLKLYVVADGMGGHDAGEVASSMAVSHLCKEAKSRIMDNVHYSLEELEQIFNTSFQCANNSIKDFSERNGSDMGTTMVAALILNEKNALIANVGDSRAYLHRGGYLYQVSKDHSFVQKMVDQNQLTPEEARHHPHSNILMRTVGTERDIKIDIFRIQLETDDTILLCSDGLWGEVEDLEMQEIISLNDDIRISARRLTEAAHLGGGKDNVTHILVQVP
jgi:PPM family protein phosphatase